MKNKKRLLLIIPILLILISTIIVISPSKKNSKIERVLKSEYYSYLPSEAQDFVRDTYEKTGQIILTEKNKEENVPYLNPQYVDYLQLSNEEKNKTEVIPNVFKTEYDYTKSTKSNDLEESYDLRDYNYITPLKNQNPLGICWAFAAAEQAESFMMVKYQRPYNNSTKILSPRQIDYATSNNGILNYQNEHGLRDLASSGNFYISSEILSYGLSLIDEAKMPFEPSGTKKELSDVLNFANSNYEVNSTINLPAIFERTGTDYGSKVAECNDIIDTDEAIQCIQNYENEIKTIYFQKIKEGIKNYGGAVVETMPPLGKCSFNNTDGNQVVDATSSCYATTEGHAMQLIG